MSQTIILSSTYSPNQKSNTQEPIKTVWNRMNIKWFSTNLSIWYTITLQKEMKSRNTKKNAHTFQFPQVPLEQPKSRVLWYSCIISSRSSYSLLSSFTCPREVWTGKLWALPGSERATQATVARKMANQGCYSQEAADETSVFDQLLWRAGIKLYKAT